MRGGNGISYDRRLWRQWEQDSVEYHRREFMFASYNAGRGTIILTGTPHGVGMAQKPPRWLRPGDSVTIEIEKIGSLTNPVQNE